MTVYVPLITIINYHLLSFDGNTKPKIINVLPVAFEPRMRNLNRFVSPWRIFNSKLSMDRSETSLVVDASARLGYWAQAIKG